MSVIPSFSSERLKAIYKSQASDWKAKVLKPMRIDLINEVNRQIKLYGIASGGWARPKNVINPSPRPNNWKAAQLMEYLTINAVTTKSHIDSISNTI